MNGKQSSGSPLGIVLLAVAALAAMSLLPWGELTSGRLKDFNLLSDLIGSAPVTYVTNEIIDPALEAALAEVEEVPADDRTFTEPVAAPADTIEVYAPVVRAAEPSRVDGLMALEDYTSGHCGLKHTRAAVAAGRLRCAVIGDSYIEGDILTATLRHLLQERCGGSGVGYVPLTSPVAGFRRTVRLQSDGWTAHDIRHDRLDSLHTLPGEYFTAASGATATFRGQKDGVHTASWSRSRFVYIAPKGGSVSTSVDGTTWTEHTLEASDDVRCITVEGQTSRFDLRSNAPALVAFGVWLDSPQGATVDCMSLRGYSGISHRSMSIGTARAMAGEVDYDLILVEYGMNALSSQQTEYSSYGHLMQRVLLRLAACYPAADIVMLGVGDRGQKQGTDVASLPTIPAIIEAQRAAARAAGVHFFDLREAMGGEGSIVEWRRRGLVNADYIHLNFKGGEVMGTELAETLMRVIDE